MSQVAVVVLLCLGALAVGGAVVAIARFLETRLAGLMAGALIGYAAIALLIRGIIREVASDIITAFALALISATFLFHNLVNRRAKASKDLPKADDRGAQ